MPLNEYFWTVNALEFLSKILVVMFLLYPYLFIRAVEEQNNMYIKRYGTSYDLMLHIC